MKNEQLSLTLADARKRRDAGIAKSGEHAGSDWRAAAIASIGDFVRVKGMTPFLAEEAREYAQRRGLALPPDGRAWGMVFQAARRAGIIEAIGYAPSRSSNLSPKVRWRAAVS